jgi:hypothetical protein
MVVLIFIGGILLGGFFAAILLSLIIAGKKKDIICYTCPSCKEKICFMDEEIFIPSAINQAARR